MASRDGTERREGVDPVREYIRRKLEERVLARLAAAPWWCLICGAGGNYEGERPDEFWFPPESHVCDLKHEVELRGLSRD